MKIDGFLSRSTNLIRPSCKLEAEASISTFGSSSHRGSKRLKRLSSMLYVDNVVGSSLSVGGQYRCDCDLGKHGVEVFDSIKQQFFANKTCFRNMYSVHLYDIYDLRLYSTVQYMFSFDSLLLACPQATDASHWIESEGGT